MADAPVPFLDLHFSHDSPRNAVLCTSGGQTMYKIKTPHKIWGRKSSTISRIITNLADDDDADGDDDSEAQLKDKFGHLARIDWHLIRRTRVVFGERDFPFESHFKKDGPLNQHRVFKTRDKILYKWDLGANGMSPPVLVLSDHPETQIAKFHPSEGLIGKHQPARLEIFEGGKAFVDHIVLTFIYVEKLRRDRTREISGAL